MKLLIALLKFVGHWTLHGPYALYLLIDNWRLRRQIAALNKKLGR